MVVASVIDSLSKIGAITGIISFVGIGLLILLVASQSRQIRAMKEWIDAEPERQAETAQRVIAEVQRRIAAARERRAAAAAGAPVPAGPARAVPPAPGTLGATPEAKAVAAAKASESTSSVATEIAPPGGSVPPPTGGDSNGEPPVFAPLTPAADADAFGSAGTDTPPVDADEPQAGDLDPVASTVGQETQAADALPLEYDPLAAATPAAQGLDPRFSDDHFDDHHYDEHFDLDHPHEEPRGNRVLFGVGAAAIVAGVVLGGYLLFGGGGESPTTKGPDGGGLSENETPTPKANPGSTPVDPSTVKVMVLNGTSVNGLAQKVTDQLSGKSYDVSPPNTFTSAGTLPTTTVKYRVGHAPEARQVAKDLGLDSSQVAPIDADVSAAAPETAQVVVVTGSDLASNVNSGSAGTTG